MTAKYPSFTTTSACDFCGEVRGVRGYLWPAPTYQRFETIHLCATHFESILASASQRGTPVGWCDQHGFGPSDQHCGCPEGRYTPLRAVPSWMRDGAFASVG